MLRVFLRLHNDSQHRHALLVHVTCEKTRVNLSSLPVPRCVRTQKDQVAQLLFGAQRVEARLGSNLRQEQQVRIVPRVFNANLFVFANQKKKRKKKRKKERKKEKKEKKE